jgi:hypothetical protein
MEMQFQSLQLVTQNETLRYAGSETFPFCGIPEREDITLTLPVPLLERAKK